MVLGMAFAVGCQAPAERTSGAPMDDPHAEHAEMPEVDPHWPMLPDDWLIGEVAGIAVDMNDHIWLIHRPRSLNADEAGLMQDPPLSSAATRRRRCSSSMPTATCSTVGVTRTATRRRLRVAGERARHLRGPYGQRLARR